MSTDYIRSLLIADDDIDDVMLLLSAIEVSHSHVLVTHVTDGEGMLDFLSAETKPELVLLDINMPKINGIDCLKKIKADKSCCDIPVIMYSTTSNSETIDECFQHGATRFFIKPYKYNEIISFIKLIFSVDWKNAKVESKEQFVLGVN